MKIVLVKWRDTTQQSKRMFEELKDCSSAVFTIIGCLYEKNKQDIKIINNYTDDERRFNCSDVYVIPRGCVISIKELRG